MWQYIISWSLLITVQVPCPDVNTEDEFGRIGSYTYCAVFHSETITKEKEKVFLSKEKAFAFYERIKNEAQYARAFSFMNFIKNVKMDSSLINNRSKS